MDRAADEGHFCCKGRGLYARSEEDDTGSPGASTDIGQAAEVGFETVSRSFEEASRGFQSMATEITDFSRRRFEDVMQSWQQLLSAPRSS